MYIALLLFSILNFSGIYFFLLSEDGKSERKKIKVNCHDCEGEENNNLERTENSG